MASEARHQFVRIVANYARLLTTVALGLVLVPVLITGVGRDGYGLYALVGSTIGFGQMFREIVRYSMNRELGAAYHSRDPDLFRDTYNSAIAVSCALALCAAGVFLLIFLIVPLLKIPPELVWPARWAALAGGFNTFCVVLLTPQFNMYMVTERMAIYNFFLTFERIGYVGAAVLLFPVLGLGDPSHPGFGFTVFSITANGISAAICAAAAATIVLRNPHLRPRPSRVTRAAVRSIIGTSGWNAVINVALNLHIRLNQLLVNLFIGVAANAAFGLAVTLTGYVRMLAVGMTDGLDAVSARMSSGEDRERAVARLLHHSTRLHAWVALPACVMVFILAEPLLDFWITVRVPHQAGLVPEVVPIVRVLIIGFTARAISDNWLRVLYGAGYVARYAPFILAGGLINPLLAVGLLVALPEGRQILGPAISFAAILTGMHLCGIPFIAARCLRLRPRDLIVPMARPALITALCTPIPILADRIVHRWGAVELAGVALVFGGTYAVLTVLVVMTAQERRRYSAALVRTLLPSRSV